MDLAAAALAKHTLLIFGLVIMAGMACGLLAKRLRIPDVALLLLAGMLLGPAGMGWIHIPASSALNQLILIFGASYILFDGGASLKLSVLKQTWITIALISTFGVLITAGITAIAAHTLLELSWPVALLLGAVIASTDPATLVPVFRQVRIRERVAQTVMSESAFNDATGAIITFVLLEIVTGQGSFAIAPALRGLAWQSAVGIVAGGVLGYLAAFGIAHARFSFLEEYAPVVTLVAVIGAYLGADGLEASGFMAVFVFGIVLGNKELFGFTQEAQEARQLEEFILTTAFVMRMFIFVLLGSQVDLALILSYGLPVIGVVLVFMLLARPVTVLLCAAPDRRARWGRQELLFMCWTRETGVIPGALAGMLVAMNAPGAQIIAAVTFVAILATILIQASSTRWLADKLGLLEEDRPVAANAADNAVVSAG
jgi:cell volume regulation protein A